MPGQHNEAIKNYYLKRLAYWRKQGLDDYAAADKAEADTKAKYGRMAT